MAIIQVCIQQNTIEIGSPEVKFMTAQSCYAFGHYLNMRQRKHSSYTCVIRYMLLVLQAADEFVVQGRNTERRWSRALQHEHSIRVQLQENTEALAKQMTRMEDEARQQFQGATAQNGPHTTNSTSKPLPNSKTGSLKREGKQNAKKHVTVSGERQVLEMIDSPDDDDDQFFDAPEISDEDWVKAASSATPTPSTPRGHKRNISTTSVNEAHDLVANSPGEGVDKPPVSSDRRMSVSLFVAHCV